MLSRQAELGPSTGSGSTPTLLGLLEDHPGLRLLVDVWKRAGVGQPLPTMSRLDPVPLGKGGMLPFVWITRGTSRQDYHLSLVGDEIRENFTANPIGKPLRELLSGELGGKMFRRVCRVIEDRVAHFSEGPVEGPSGRRYLGTRVMLPLVDDRDSPGSTAILGGFQKARETVYVDPTDQPMDGPEYSLEQEFLFDPSAL